MSKKQLTKKQIHEQIKRFGLNMQAWELFTKKELQEVLNKLNKGMQPLVSYDNSLCFIYPVSKYTV